MMIEKPDEQVYALLKRLQIKYVRYEHSPVFTIEQSELLNLKTCATRCKNLFLRNKKGNQHYLVIMEHFKFLDLKRLSSQIGSNALSLASAERMLNLLGIAAGAVGPFGLMNDKEKQVTVLIDRELRASSSVSFHPNVNTVTIEISFSDFQNYLDWCSNKVLYVDI